MYLTNNIIFDILNLGLSDESIFNATGDINQDPANERIQQAVQEFIEVVKDAKELNELKEVEEPQWETDDDDDNNSNDAEDFE